MSVGQYGVGRFITDEQKKDIGLGENSLGMRAYASGAGRYDTTTGELHPTYSAPRTQQDVFKEQRNRELAALAAQRREAASRGETSGASLAAYEANRKKIHDTYQRNLATLNAEETAQPQNAAQPQRAAGGGQAIAAENPDQQTVAATRQTTTGNGVENYTAGGLNFARSKNERGETVLAATDGSGGTARAVLHGGGNQQQSRPGLGLNGMRDLGNGQVAVGQVGRLENPGYSYVGPKEGANAFFQHVGRPGGYNPYRQSIGPTLHDKLVEARWSAKATPQPEEDEPMGWKRRDRQRERESRERIAEMTGGFGLTQAGLQDARAREQLAQQYGINMAQLGNDNLRTQAALGLSGLQQQQAMQQMRQQQMLDNARQTYATARPGSQEWIQARNTIQAYRQGGENEQKPFEIGEDVDPETGSKTKRYGVRTEDGIMPLQVTGGQTGGDVASMYAHEKDWLDSEQIKQLNGIKDQKKREAAKQALFLRHYGIGG